MRLDARGWTGSIDLPKLSQELYRSARWLRVFTANRTEIPEAPLLRFLRRPVAEVRAMVEAGEKLLA
jgi:hypothetical protein